MSLASTQELKAAINAYVSDTLSRSKYTPKAVQDKVIRCSVFGFNVFRDYEISLIDSPFLQRLRGIYQTALALYTYPGATHTRFEHSLGCATNAEKMLRALREKNRSIDDTHWAEVRLAALLHDVGHGPFSHASEKVYNHFDDFEALFKKIEKEEQETFVGCSRHEILSYLIITSEEFKKFFQKIAAISPNDVCSKIDLDRVGRMVVGRLPEKNHPELKYLSQIINGPFDVDKIDYIHRDGHHTGLKTDVDVERLFLTLDLVLNKDGERVLSVDLSGGTVLEQMFFNKSILFSSVYHHHKIRSSLCAIIALFEYIRQKNLTIRGLDFSSPVHFLQVDEYDILNECHSDSVLNEIIGQIKQGRFLKRALVITQVTLENDSMGPVMFDIESDPVRLKEIEAEISTNVFGDDPPVKSIFVDFPDRPRFDKAAKECLVRLSKSRTEPLSEVYPVRGLVTGYSQYRFKAFVFCPEGYEQKVGLSAYELFKSQGLILKNTAFELAKQDMSYIQGALDHLQ